MKALVGTDGSPCSQVAADLVGRLPWPADTTLRLIAVLDPLAQPGVFVGFAPIETRSLEADLTRDLETMVEAASENLAGSGRSVEHRVLCGRPSSAICEEAHRFGADLIAVGSRGRGPIEGMLLGSVSAEVVGRATCPVLVARGRSVQRVLLAHDGSEQACRAEDILATWPIFEGARIDVLSVAHAEVDWEDTLVVPFAYMRPVHGGASHDVRAHHQEIARSSALRLGRAGRTADWTVSVGDPAHAILKVAQQSNADLVVMGTRGLTGVRRLVVGSVARNVLRHAHCSVMVIPAQP
jgi:nucleotide-binding universal stress UspA family protein